MERMDVHRSVILAIAMGIVLLLGLLFMTGNSRTNANNQESRQNDAAVKVVRTSLDLYYLNSFRTYPMEISEVGEKLPSDESRQGLGKAIKELEGFDYSVRGDRQAYQFTYTEGGETKTVKGSYSNDYH